MSDTQDGLNTESRHYAASEEGQATTWSVDTLQIFLSAKITDLRDMLQERYVMQTKAVDSAFNAQQTAMKTAKDEQTVAMTTALTAQKDAINAAMAASDKAGAKAETAADKRFESVNEFRKQLGDQADTFATKSDMDIRMKALSDKFDYESKNLHAENEGRSKAINDLKMDITHRLDLSQGQETGTNDARGNRRQDTSINIAIGGIILAVISAVITILTMISRAQ